MRLRGQVRAGPPRVAVFDAYPYVLGGAHVVAERIARAGSDSQRWETIVVLPDEGAVADWFRIRGATVRVTVLPGSLLRFARSWRRRLIPAVAALPVAWWRLFSAFADVDIVHADDVRGLVLAGLPALARRRSLVVHIHHGDPGGRGWRWFVRGPIRWLGISMVVPSRRAAAGWIRPIDGRVVELANPVEPVGRTAESSDPTIVTLSRIHPEKGLTYLFDAMDLLRARGVAPRLRIAGGTASGHEGLAEDLATRAAPFGDIELLGEVAKPQEVLAGAWLYVQPSVAEALPNAVLEAAAMGLPIVATGVGGLPDIVVDGVTGYLVPPRDPAALADALASLLAAPEQRQRFGLAGLRWVTERFSSAGFTETLAALYVR